MFKLPNWVIPDNHPAFFDSESATAIEMVAKLYGTFQEIVDDYNEFITKVNKELAEFEAQHNKDWETYSVSLRQEFQDFIDIINLKIKGMDADIHEAIETMVIKIEESVQKYLEVNGVNVQLDYDVENEALSLKSGMFGPVIATHDGQGNVSVIRG